MKEKPILFSGEMVRAILDGRKTQTRRVIKPQPKLVYDKEFEWNDWVWGPCKWSEPTIPQMCALDGMLPRCPYGKPGNALWVRETWGVHFMYDPLPPSHIRACDSKTGAWETGDKIWYKADNHVLNDLGSLQRWRPSIHMPRWASRITLEITDVRVERVQSITLGDICKEGLARSIYDFKPAQKGIDAWIELWNSINATRGYGWDVNPWVWRVTFKPIKKAQQ